MIRCVRMKGYYLFETEEEGQFAFIDTVRDRFVEFGGEQFWETREEFAQAVASIPETNLAGREVAARCERLIPLCVK